MDSRLTLMGAAVFAVGILLLALSLHRVVKRIRYRDTGDKAHQPPASPSILGVILALVLVAIGQCFIWLSSQIETFRPLSAEASIGKVWIERQDDPVKSLKVTYVPLAGDTWGAPNVFYLSGDSWRLSGEIIEFKFAQKYLKLPDRIFKTTGFYSNFLQRLPPNASGALLNENALEGGSSAAFRLFRNSRYFKWFAEVDSFATEYHTTTRRDSFLVQMDPEGPRALCLDQ